MNVTERRKHIRRSTLKVGDKEVFALSNIEQIRLCVPEKLRPLSPNLDPNGDNILVGVQNFKEVGAGYHFSLENPRTGERELLPMRDFEPELDPQYAVYLRRVADGQA